ncbi:hypothetical protein [Bacillus pseudomycoides]|uniref:hypothetical protein n=1 Tax=Bacillus pseudomycoides TaxID=64104 RepID=UPI000BF5977C|nr:hypothetical protein [Bacillus pseudomycoides]PFW93926.1 hypothetical protein COL29_12370 [Bacillus pseudomycoides]
MYLKKKVRKRDIKELKKKINSDVNVILIISLGYFTYNIARMYLTKMIIGNENVPYWFSIIDDYIVLPIYFLILIVLLFNIIKNKRIIKTYKNTD